MASNIDVTVPTTGAATTQSMRDNFAAMKEELEALQDYYFVGLVELFPGGTSSSVWLPCDGSEVSRTEYPELFTAIGTTFGEGDGSTTFNLPEVYDRFPVGANGASSGYDLGDTGGEAEVTLTQSQMPLHGHTASNAGTHDHGGETSEEGDHSHAGSTDSVGGHTHTGSTNSAGAHEHLVDIDTDQSSFGDLGIRTAGGTVSGVSEEFTLKSAGNHRHAISLSSNGTHTHTATTDTDGAHSHGIATGGNHSHTISEVGEGEAHENRPPYLAIPMYILARI